MDQIGEEIKKVVQAGIGAVAVGMEKAQEAVDSLSKKGQPIYEHAKSAVTDAAGKVKQAFDQSGIADALCGKIKADEIIDALKNLSPEDQARVREALDALKAQAAATPDEQPQDPPTDGDIQA